MSRQIFQFDNGSVLISQSGEVVDTSVPFDRVVTGGTGDCAHAPETQRQILQGMTENGGVRNQVELNDTPELKAELAAESGDKG